MMESSQEQQAQCTSSNTEAEVDVDIALRNALTLRQLSHQSWYHSAKDSAPLTISLPPSTTPFIKIGAGTCGAVFAQPQSPLAFKLSKITDHEVLWNDYFHRLQICDEFTSVVCWAFTSHNPTTSSLLVTPLTTASEFVNLPTSVLVSERIPPVPARIRNLLIDKFCRDSARDVARNNQANGDCLIRVYLGSMLGKSKDVRQLPVFSLRNFNLHLNQMIEIGLDHKVLANRIGKAMAFLHPMCNNDAADVEFVLGGKPMHDRSHISLPIRPRGLDRSSEGGQYTGPESFQDEDLFANKHLYPNNQADDDEVALWLLDFNRVKALNHTSIITEGCGQNSPESLESEP